MNLKRCDNGHFYDGEKFQACPHCAAIGGDMNITMPYGEPQGAYPQAAPEPVTVAMYQQPVAPEPTAENMSLKDAVNRAVSAPPQMQDEEKTISIYQTRDAGIDPVVGWLVCIEGNDFGGSFTIKSGRNFIGRASNMDIVIQGDNSVSREKHAVILYEPKKRDFIAQAGESRELFYLNEEVVLNSLRLKQYDILTIGNTRLMFFPCCGENFSWDDFKKDEGK